jgi:hypothetical protein
MAVQPEKNFTCAMDCSLDTGCPGCTALEAKLERAQEFLRNAKKAAREGLMDMAEQNAKLVAAYVEKKREVKQLQVSVDFHQHLLLQQQRPSSTLCVCAATMQQGTQQQSFYSDVVLPRICISCHAPELVCVARDSS